MLFFASALGTAFIGLRRVKVPQAHALLTGEPVAWMTVKPERRHVVGSLLFGLGWAVGRAPGADPANSARACRGRWRHWPGWGSAGVLQPPRQQTGQRPRGPRRRRGRRGQATVSPWPSSIRFAFTMDGWRLSAVASTCCRRVPTQRAAVAAHDDVLRRQCPRRSLCLIPRSSSATLRRGPERRRRTPGTCRKSVVTIATRRYAGP